MIVDDVLQAGEISRQELLLYYGLVFSGSSIVNNRDSDNAEFLKRTSDTIMRDRVMLVVVDMNISEKYSKNWKEYHTKVAATAKISLLSLEDELPRLVDRMAQFVSGLF